MYMLRLLITPPGDLKPRHRLGFNQRPIRLITPRGDLKRRLKTLEYEQDYGTHYPSWGFGTSTARGGAQP